jgi:ParB family chromosome partitioning protein
LQHLPVEPEGAGLFRGQRTAETAAELLQLFRIDLAELLGRNLGLADLGELIDEHKYSQVELAGVIGKSRSHIANTLRLLALPEAVQVYLLDGRLTAGHGRALLTLADPLAAARRILNEGMSVRDAEALDDNDGGGQTRHRGSRKPAIKDADTRALEKTLSDALGLEVTIAHKASGGEVRVRYKTLEQLDDIGRRLRRA